MTKFLLPFFALLVVGCTNPGTSNVEGEVEQDIIGDQYKSYLSLPSVMGDTSLQVIRTADIRFRVQDVSVATDGIEAIVTRMGGVVTSTNLENNIEKTERENVSKDNAIEAVLYTVTNKMVLRVETSKMDTTLRAIAKYVDFLDYRILEARDVMLNMLSEQLEIQRNKDYVGQVASNSSNPNVADKILDAKRNVDQANLTRYMLESQMRYCTIELTIYQSNKMSYNTVAVLNDDRISPSFSYELSEALDLSWTIVVGLFLLLVRLSGLIVVGLGIFLGVRYWVRYSKSKKQE